MNHPSTPSNRARKADPDVMAAIEAALAAEESAPPTPAPASSAPVQNAAPAASAPVPTPRPAPVSAPAARPAPAANTGGNAVQHDHATGLNKEQVDAMLEESHEFRKKRKARQKVGLNLLLVGLFLGLIGGAYGWYASSPDNQAKVHGLWGDVQAVTSGESKDSLSDIIDSYDESLDKIAVRGAQVREATIALGADPDAVDAEGDAALEAAMKEMMGGETTTFERDQMVREKFGALAEVMRAKVDADREEQEAKRAAEAAEAGAGED